MLKLFLLSVLCGDFFGHCSPSSSESCAEHETPLEKFVNLQRGWRGGSTWACWLVSQKLHPSPAKEWVKCPDLKDYCSNGSFLCNNCQTNSGGPLQLTLDPVYAATLAKLLVTWSRSQFASLRHRQSLYIAWRAKDHELNKTLSPCVYRPMAIPPAIN